MQINNEQYSLKISCGAVVGESDTIGAQNFFNFKLLIDLEVLLLIWYLIYLVIMQQRANNKYINFIKYKDKYKYKV